MKPEPEQKTETVQLIDVEIFSALVHYIGNVGILNHWRTTIQPRLHQVKQTRRYNDGDRIANGAYLYKVTTKTANQTQEVVEKLVKID